jgi:hypothetical protein
MNPPRGMSTSVGMSLRRVESREWIYDRKKKPKGTLRAGFSALRSFVEPQIEHIINDRNERRRPC